VRAVLDANVLVSALLSPHGSPGLILARWIDGDFELLVSPRLLNELERTLRSSKLRGRVTPDQRVRYGALLRRAEHVDDPRVVPARAPDKDDDYLLALAESERAMLVSGDQHLLGLADEYPIVTPKVFLETLQTDD
jgi:uncharacterized protein